jgi:hypothetical protein
MACSRITLTFTKWHLHQLLTAAFLILKNVMHMHCPVLFDIITTHDKNSLILNDDPERLKQRNELRPLLGHNLSETRLLTIKNSATLRYTAICFKFCYIWQHCLQATTSGMVCEVVWHEAALQ